MIGNLYLDDHRNRSLVRCKDVTYILDKDVITNRALHGDTIRYNIKENRVEEVITRSNKLIAGYLRVSSIVIEGFNKRKVPKKKFICNNKCYPTFIVATKSPYQSTDLYTLIKPLRWNKDDKFPTGCIEIIIGNVSDYNAELEYLKVRNNIKWPKINIKDIVDIDLDTDLTPEREDITNLVTFSVDPPGCKDIDDALHIKEVGNNLVEIGVHIADVSSYIVEESELDKKIRSRGQSVYLEKEQINMLPDKLATETCSLIEGHNKRVFTVLFTIDMNRKEVISYKFQKSLIVNNKAMSYDDAEIITNSNYKAITPLDKSLKLVYNLGNLLHGNSSSKYDTHKMIEIFMCMANVAVANTLHKNNIHESLLRVCKGVKLENENNKNSSYQDAIKMSNLLKLDAAYYAVGSNLGHTPLDEKYYTHFTSPIRRYYDIAVHRQLYSLISEEYKNDNDNHYKLSVEKVEELNYKSRLIKRAERESYVLELIYSLYNEYESNICVDGYVISILDNKVILYVPRFKIVLDSYIFSNEIKHTLDYESNDGYILYNNKKIQLYDNIKLELIVKIKEPRFKNKLMVKIIEPNFSLFI